MTMQLIEGALAGGTGPLYLVARATCRTDALHRLRQQNFAVVMLDLSALDGDQIEALAWRNTTFSPICRTGPC
jgi:hypothetical protein